MWENSHVRCGAGEKPETLETVGLPIAIRDPFALEGRADGGLHGGDLETVS